MPAACQPRGGATEVPPKFDEKEICRPVKAWLDDSSSRLFSDSSDEAWLRVAGPSTWQGSVFMCHSSQSWSQRSDDGYSDDDDDDAAFDVEETEDAGACSEEDDAIVMSGVDLANEQEQQIDKIAGLFDLSRVAASSLLRRYAWKEERLIEEVLSDRERALDKAGVKRQRSDAGPSTDSFECGVCFADYCATDGSALRCGHRFCNSCWKMHLTAQLGDGNAQAIRCMHDECTALVEPALAQALLDGASYAKFARFAQRQFVDDSPLLKWRASLPRRLADQTCVPDPCPPTAAPEGPLRRAWLGEDGA